MSTPSHAASASRVAPDAAWLVALDVDGTIMTEGAISARPCAARSTVFATPATRS
ncbi:hypothetical protein [Frondihabitans sucicola]|uniref:hypothetical protein n=1 Tax=Frondihabitans sucicola TaxID=1268041 RepID=UPI002573B286|nr:hypothetical protein [Frondihabitans sucicola]